MKKFLRGIWDEREQTDFHFFVAFVGGIVLAPIFFMQDYPALAVLMAGYAIFWLPVRWLTFRRRKKNSAKR